MIPWWRNCCSASCHRSASLSCMGGAALNRRSPKNPGPLFCCTEQITIMRRSLSISYLSPLLGPHEIFLDTVINLLTNHFSLKQYGTHMMLGAPPLSLLESCYTETHECQVDISPLIVHRTSRSLHHHHQDIYTSESEPSGTALSSPVMNNKCLCVMVCCVGICIWAAKECCVCMCTVCMCNTPYHVYTHRS